MASAKNDKRTGKDCSRWSEKFSFHGVVRFEPKKSGVCHLCDEPCAKARVEWLTDGRWLCGGCAKRYLAIEKSARLCGVRQLPYVAEDKYRAPRASLGVWGFDDDSWDTDPLDELDELALLAG